MAKRKRRRQQTRQSQKSQNWGIIGVGAIALLLLVGGYFILLADNPDLAPGAERLEAGPQAPADGADAAKEAVAVEVPDLPIAPQVGALAPDFTLADTTGAQVSLTDYRGKPVVVSFFHTW